MRGSTVSRRGLAALAGIALVASLATATLGAGRAGATNANLSANADPAGGSLSVSKTGGPDLLTGQISLSVSGAVTVTGIQDYYEVHFPSRGNKDLPDGCNLAAGSSTNWYQVPGSYSIHFTATTPGAPALGDATPGGAAMSVPIAADATYSYLTNGSVALPAACVGANSARNYIQITYTHLVEDDAVTSSTHARSVSIETSWLSPPTSTPTTHDLATATPTATTTATATATLTRGEDGSPTATPTATVTTTATATPTATASPSRRDDQPTSTPTATPSPGHENAPAPTNTPTATATPTARHDTSPPGQPNGTTNPSPTSTPARPASPPAPAVLGAVATVAPPPAATPTPTRAAVLASAVARPASLPRTGGAPGGLLVAALLGGTALASGGALLRRRLNR